MKPVAYPMIENSQRTLRAFVNRTGGSLAAIQMLIDGDWINLAQNGMIGNPDVRRNALINMIDYCGRLAPDAGYSFDPETGLMRADSPRFLVNPKWHYLGLHGPANQSLYQIIEAEANEIALELDTRTIPAYPSPSALHVKTVYTIDDMSLIDTVTITNVGDKYVPIGCGSHGLFDKYPGSAMTGPKVKFNAVEMFNRDSNYPTEAMPDGTTIAVPPEHDFSAGRIPLEIYDTVFSGWDGTASAFWEALGLGLELTDESAEPTIYLHLWYDASRGTWAFEPVTAFGNAFNLAVKMNKTFGIRILAPGQSTGFRHRYRYSYLYGLAA